MTPGRIAAVLAVIAVGALAAVLVSGDDGTYTVRAEFDGVVEPVDDPAQPVLVGGRRRISGKRADEAQRVDLPPDRVFNPGGFTHGLNVASYRAFMVSASPCAGPSTARRPGASGCRSRTRHW